MRYTKTVPAAVLALMVTAACDSSDPPVGPSGASLNRGALQQQSIRTPDDEFARVARAEVPGFAGFYLQNDGTPVVLLTDPAQRGAAQRYLAREFVRARRGRHANAPTQPIFLKAAYDFAQLKEWSEALHPMLARSDVFLIDVDEVGNRVSVGVQDASAIAAVRAEGARLGIPANALFVQTQPRPELRITVRDRQSYLRGGIQIAFGSGLCTQGFNGRRASNGQSLFVTNSHCTATYFGFDGTTLYQNVVASGNAVGSEVSDIGLYACDGAGTSCRKADAAYIAHNGTRTVDQGGIARTNWNTGGPGGLDIIGEFDIVARYTGTLPVGSYLDKTGRTSGSTYGQVTSSCVTIGNLRCQDISKVWSEPGDSGSPVYVWITDNDVHLHGVMWGGPGSDFTTTYSSRLSGIEQDLGALTNLCRPGFGC
jgi:hypothetical protein